MMHSFIMHNFLDIIPQPEIIECYSIQTISNLKPDEGSNDDHELSSDAGRFKHWMLINQVSQVSLGGIFFMNFVAWVGGERKRGSG